jgi:hypothetical protein
MNGQLVNVTTQILGSELAQNYTSGLQLYVEDISIFGDEGVLQIGTIWSDDRETVPYMTIIDTDEFEAPYLELGTELVNDYDVDENVVQPYPLTTVKMATAYVSGGGDFEVPLASGVWSLVEDGTRDDAEGEIVVIEDGMVTSLYGQAPSISGDYIAFLEAGKISAGTLDANVVTIASQDNNIIIDSNGILAKKAGDESTFVQIDANEENGKVLKIVKGALEIRDKDEAVIIDKDGLVADGIIRGVMPGSNNPITNSSFERVDASDNPVDWTKGGTTPANISTDNTKNRFGTKCFYCNNTTATDAKATQTVQVQQNTTYALSVYWQAAALGSTPIWGAGETWGGGHQWGEPAEGGSGDRGAEIKVWDDAVEKVSTGVLWGTQSTWQRTMTTTFDSGSATELDIEINIGTVADPTVGKFWCDAILLQEGAVIMPWNISLHDYLEHTSDTTQHGAESSYPVGSIYINANVATNPSDPSMLGFGTWVAFGSGRIPVGLDSGDTDFDTAEETGGAKTVALSQANLPNVSTGAGTSHNHTQNSHNHTQNSHNHSQNSHDHSNSAHIHSALIYTGNSKYLSLNTGGSQYKMTWSGTNGLTNDTRPSQVGITIDNKTATNVAQTATNVAQTATNNAEAAHTHSLGGSGTAHSNVQPYIVVYMWKRTA